MPFQVVLNARREDASDPMGRSHIGWEPGMTEQECWEAGRGVWVCNPAFVLDYEEIEILNYEGNVVAVGTIDSVSKYGDRYAVNGQLLAGDSRVGKPPAATNNSRNPVKYIP